jgi:bifunctional aspartokinase / homoserine dehydrogenase 1
MSLLVMKFGGTSVGGAAAIESLAAITRDQRAAWGQVAVVVSAMSGVTDLLIEGARTATGGDRLTYLEIARRLRDKHAAALAELAGATKAASSDRGAVGDEIERLVDEFELLCHSVSVLGEVSPRALDAISGLGERMSARLVAAVLRARDIPAEALDATELVLTSADFGNAIPLQPQTRVRIRSLR